MGLQVKLGFSPLLPNPSPLKIQNENRMGVDASVLHKSLGPSPSLRQLPQRARARRGLRASHAGGRGRGAAAQEALRQRRRPGGRGRQAAGKVRCFPVHLGKTKELPLPVKEGRSPHYYTQKKGNSPNIISGQYPMFKGIV